MRTKYPLVSLLVKASKVLEKQTAVWKETNRRMSVGIGSLKQKEDSSVRRMCLAFQGQKEQEKLQSHRPFESLNVNDASFLVALEMISFCPASPFWNVRRSCCAGSGWRQTADLGKTGHLWNVENRCVLSDRRIGLRCTHSKDPKQHPEHNDYVLQCCVPFDLVLLVFISMKMEGYYTILSVVYSGHIIHAPDYKKHSIGRPG